MPAQILGSAAEKRGATLAIAAYIVFLLIEFKRLPPKVRKQRGLYGNFAQLR